MREREVGNIGTENILKRVKKNEKLKRCSNGIGDGIGDSMRASGGNDTGTLGW